jgi:hypothetical protein
VIATDRMLSWTDLVARCSREFAPLMVGDDRVRALLELLDLGVQRLPRPETMA